MNAHTNMVACVLQAFGLGDVIFSMGVIEHFRWYDGYKILWPVKSHFVLGLNRAYPNITFAPDDYFSPDLFNIKEKTVYHDMKIIPIRWSDSILGVSSKFWMRAKYDLYGLDYKKWRNYEFNRDRRRENELYKIYDLAPNEKFNLINDTFRTGFTGNIPINTNNGLRDIKMKIIPGYSLFDHSSLIQTATNIYAVNSAMFYLLEMLDLSAKEIHLYSRIPDEVGFPFVDYLMTKNYILHQ